MNNITICFRAHYIRKFTAHGKTRRMRFTTPRQDTKYLLRRHTSQRKIHEYMSYNDQAFNITTSNNLLEM